MRDNLRRAEEFAAPIGGSAKGLELRGAPRFTLLIRAGKLVCREGEFLCIVRDASDTGVNVRLFHALPDTDAMVLELQNGDRHALELVWQQDDRAGLKFVRQADIRRIVECPSRFAKRPIRLNMEVPAHVIAGDVQVPVTIRDLSQQGAKLLSRHRFSIDQRVKLVAPGFPEVQAKVRWRGDESCGLVFEDTFQFGDLARVAATLQTRKSA